MIGTIISTFCMVILLFIMWSDLSNIDINWKSIRTWLFIVVTVSATLLNYFNVSNVIKIINMTLIFIVIHKLFFKTSYKWSIFEPIVTQLLYLISESIVSIFMISILKNDITKYVDNFFGSFIMNISMAFLTFILFKTPLFKKIYDKIFKTVSTFDDSATIFLFILCLLTYSIYGFNVFYGMNPKFLMLLSMLVSIIFFIIVFMFFKAKDDYYKIYDKYNSSLLSLKEFEDVLNNYRVDNHENRNHLLAIRNMTKNKKVINFIDTILENNIKDDNNIMHETSVIPSGGLRGLIYSKLLVMNNKEIEYELDVDRTVRVVNMLSYGEDVLLDICKIVGIFLDNAIEEVEKLDEKYIIIEIYNDEDVLTISITNIFDNSIEKTNIYKPGYSTKGGNHGYGLSLVKKITSKNSKLKTHHEINDNEFTQILQIFK